jgi:hypothetical protein
MAEDKMEVQDAFALFQSLTMQGLAGVSTLQ